MSEPTKPKRNPIQIAILVGMVCGVIGWLFITPSHWGYHAEGKALFTATDAKHNPVSFGMRSSSDIMAGSRYWIDISKNVWFYRWFYGLSEWVVLGFCTAVGFVGSMIIQSITNRKSG